jgi:hypothetical protein
MTVTYKKHSAYSLFFVFLVIPIIKQCLPQVIPLRTIGAIGRYLIFLSPRTKLLKQKL